MRDFNSFLNLGFQGVKTNFFRPNFPYKLTFAITYRCNARCKICGIWKMPFQNELSLEEIEKFAKNSNFKWINLTGGEIFLRNDLIEIVKVFAKFNRPYVINAISNGISTNLILNSVKEILNIDGIGKVIIGISIDGPESLHNELRGIYCWQNAIQTYKGLINFSKKYKNFSNYIGFTLSPFNLGYLNKTYEILHQECGLKKENFHINIMEVSETYYRNKKIKLKNKNEFYQKAREEIQDFYKDRKKLINPVNILDDLYLKWLDKYLYTQKTPLSCQALNASVFVDPLGNIYPCIILNKKLANLREIDYDLKKVWDSKIFTDAREQIKKGCCSQQCWTPCEAYQSIIGNIFKAIFFQS